jgi:hypothetical protein
MKNRLIFLSLLPLVASGCQSRTEHVARLPHALGLREGAKVVAAGLEIGRVDSLDFEGDAVQVRFSIPSRRKLTLHADACVGVVDGDTLELSPGLEPGLRNAQEAVPACAVQPGETSFRDAAREMGRAGAAIMGEMLRAAESEMKAFRDEHPQGSSHSP